MKATKRFRHNGITILSLNSKKPNVNLSLSSNSVDSTISFIESSASKTLKTLKAYSFFFRGKTTQSRKPDKLNKLYSLGLNRIMQ